MAILTEFHGSRQIGNPGSIPAGTRRGLSLLLVLILTAKIYRRGSWISFHPQKSTSRDSG